MEHWKVTPRGEDLLIVARGHDKQRAYERSLLVFDGLAATREQFTLYADLSEMTGYESETRKAWQELLRGHRSRIRKLVFIGARFALIRMGAAAVGAFAAIPVVFVDRWDQLAPHDVRA